MTTQKNICTLTGFVGNVTKREVSGKTVAFICLATHHSLKNTANESIIETTWHNVKLWEGKNVSPNDIKALEKGTKISVAGRLVNEKSTPIILASSLTLLDEKTVSTENRIELTGYVGTVSQNTVGATKIIRFTLATTLFQKNNKDKSVVGETTWHTVNVFTGDKFPEDKMSQIKKGTPLTVVGRIHTTSIVDKAGKTRRIVDIIPIDITFIDANNPDQPIQYNDAL